MERSEEKLGTFLASARNKLELTLRAVEAKTGISNAYTKPVGTRQDKDAGPAEFVQTRRTLSCTLRTIDGIGRLSRAKRSIGRTWLSLSLSSFAARIGTVTVEEEEALVEYLQFIRSRRRRR